MFGLRFDVNILEHTKIIPRLRRGLDTGAVLGPGQAEADYQIFKTTLRLDSDYYKNYGSG